jgi:endonuclease/exonuclease/phosphatase family metal-dependent hydrolase
MSANLKLATFNCNNLFARYKFKSDTDPQQALQNGWLANAEDFEINDETEKQLTAQAISETNADVTVVQEVESLPALRLFKDTFLQDQQYKYTILIAGNDPRLINVGVLSRYPIESIDTHIHEIDSELNEPLFSRDCLECDIVLPENNKKLRLYVNHLKSMLDKNDPCNGRKNTMKKRMHQAKRIKEIVLKDYPNSSKQTENNGLEDNHPFVILGDLNDYMKSDEQGEPAIGDIVNWERVENIIATRLPEEEQWTEFSEGFPKCNRPESYSQLDYILLSKKLADKNKSKIPQIIRKGLELKATKYNGPRFEGITGRKRASDHCPVVIELEI